MSLGEPDRSRLGGWRGTTAPLVLLHGYVPQAGYYRVLADDIDHERRAARQLLNDALEWVREHFDDVDVSAKPSRKPHATTASSRGSAPAPVTGRRPTKQGKPKGTQGKLTVRQACPAPEADGQGATPARCRGTVRGGILERDVKAS
ncbi:hypothetical protein ACFYSJ_40495 [Streptomyces sp. NPDC005248]|uniref:hypothetical protein n=1 Tax=unclassified Streptomyces TaxID=2593676 RepID=UPI003680CDF9